MYYVYVLYSSSIGKKNIGFTNDLRERFRHHNAGLDRWSKRGIPWELIYYEAYQNEKDARKREAFLKTGRGYEVLSTQLKSTLENKVQIITSTFKST